MAAPTPAIQLLDSLLPVVVSPRGAAVRFHQDRLPRAMASRAEAVYPFALSEVHGCSVCGFPLARPVRRAFLPRADGCSVFHRTVAHFPALALVEVHERLRAHAVASFLAVRPDLPSTEGRVKRFALLSCCGATGAAVAAATLFFTPLGVFSLFSVPSSTGTPVPVTVPVTVSVSVTVSPVLSRIGSHTVIIRRSVKPCSLR